MLSNILFYFQPHSLDGIKISKDKKKNTNQEVDGNQKLESNDNVKTHTKDKEHKCGNRTRRKSSEILTVASPATSYAQVIVIYILYIMKDLRITIYCTIMYGICSHLQREEQRKKLNSILLNLLQRMPNKKDPLDLSFLLERNRRNRKRPGGLNP